jgi:hypothetical protein
MVKLYICSCVAKFDEGFSFTLGVFSTKKKAELAFKDFLKGEEYPDRFAKSICVAILDKPLAGDELNE